MAYAQNAEEIATTEKSRSGLAAVLLAVARKQQRSSREGRDDGRAAEEEAEETFKGVSFMSRLPLDLAMEVVRRLPLRSLVQMRTLSSSFNALLRAPPKTLRLCRQPPWLVTVRAGAAGLDMRAPRELAAYCPLSGTWFPFPPMSEGLLSAMGGPGLLQVPSLYQWDLCPLLSLLAMASAGGLMCAVVTALRPEAERRQAPPPPEGLFYVDGYLSQYVFKCDDFYLLVFNVFTGASERVPPPLPTEEPLQGNSVFVHMFLDASAPGAYYLVLQDLDTGFRLRVLHIYSSRIGCWRVGHAASAQPSPCTFGDICQCDMFQYNEAVDHPAVLAYSFHSDAWLKMPIAPLPKRSSWSHVFKWRGHVFLAGTRELATSFRVSVLTSASRWSDTATWVEVARTPSSLVQPFFTDADIPNLDYVVYDVRFVVCGNLVCMSTSHGPNRGYHNIFLQPVVYDLAGRSWYALPPPCIKGNKSTDFGVGLLAFQPDLQATP
ncbi:hypothetical protein L7F22_059893 [Adiantum nelumboides]|nr:hypothetical protein [Adiantum nelumboides]